MASFLRNHKRRKVPVEEGVCERRRADIFNGKDLVDALLSAETKDFPVEYAVTDRAAALKLGSQLLKNRVFLACEKGDTLHRNNNYDFRPDVKTMIEDSQYIWLMPASNKHLYVYSGLMLCCVLFVTCIKIWPIWLKIFIWWLSLIALVSMSSIILVRLVVYALFWVVGVRDIWLLPNFLDDDADFEELLTPLFGRGTKVERARNLKRMKEEAERADKLRAEGKTVAETSQAAQAPAKCSGLQFGIVNLVVILVLGLCLCFHFGMFKGENIPEFLAKKVEVNDRDGWMEEVLNVACLDVICRYVYIQDEIYNGYAFLLDDPTLYVYQSQRIHS